MIVEHTDKSLENYKNEVSLYNNNIWMAEPIFTKFDLQIVPILWKVINYVNCQLDAITFTF